MAETAAISARNLALSVGGNSLLEDLTLDVAPGAFCAVLGPNGAGKSTLLKLIIGLLAPTAGRLEVLGATAGSPALARRIGYVPQVKTLDRTFPALAIDLVASGITGSWPWRIPPAHLAQAETALAQAGALELAQRALGVLSGGELQRVYLARALARQPRLLLLDEPAAGIDAAGEHDMFHILEDYQRKTGATVLLVSHDWGAAWHHASQALLLSRRLLASGPPREVLTDGALREAFGHSGHSHGMGWQPPAAARRDGAPGSQEQPDA
jgi:zinc transport system ATP-binding protein